MKTLLLLAAPLLLTACAHSSMPLTENAEKVSVVNSLPASEAAKMSDIGEIAIEESWEYQGDIQDIRTELRNTAAREGVDVILLEQEGRQPCEVDSTKKCLFERGRKYRRADAGPPATETL